MPKLFRLPALTLFPGRIGSRWPRRCARILLLLAIAMVGSEAVRVLFGNNLHWVISERVLRGAQLSPNRLHDVIQKYGIRTVINLRGCSNPFDWYVNEARATAEHGISQEDITLSAYRFPAPQEIRRLVEVLDGSEYPVYIHCRRGSDRTGLVAGIARLLQPGSTLADGRSECSIRFGHLNMLHTARMDDFFDFYEEWLQQNGLQHSPGTFRNWAANHYTAGHGKAHLEWIDAPAAIHSGEASAFRVRVRNDSRETWSLQPGTMTGIHLRFIVSSAEGKAIHADRAGQFRRDVRPGESIDLLLGVPPLRKPGHYLLQADMVDKEQTAFVQLGSELLLHEFRVVD